MTLGVFLKYIWFIYSQVKVSSNAKNVKKESTDEDSSEDSEDDEESEDEKETPKKKVNF